MYAVVRLKGKAGVREKILDVLKMLNLNDKFNCTVVPEDENYEGMLEKVKNFVTWGEIEEDTLQELLEKRGKVTEEGKDPEEATKEVAEGKKLKEAGVNPNIRLTPPSGGFKGEAKKMYPEGEAGYRGQEINVLLEKMI